MAIQNTQTRETYSDTQVAEMRRELGEATTDFDVSEMSEESVVVNAVIHDAETGETYSDAQIAEMRSELEDTEPELDLSDMSTKGIVTNALIRQEDPAAE